MVVFIFVMMCLNCFSGSSYDDEKVSINISYMNNRKLYPGLFKKTVLHILLIYYSKHGGAITITNISSAQLVFYDYSKCFIQISMFKSNTGFPGIQE